MSKGPAALADILSGLPSEADYDTVFAAIMVSEGGRWFLSEFANRNRHADTQMLVGALGRVEAAIRGGLAPHTTLPVQAEPPKTSAPLGPPTLFQRATPENAMPAPIAAPALCRDLIEIAAAINRVEALVEGGEPASDGYTAVERIRDIAFALREREFESALCDALDYAARSISEVFASSDSAAQRARAAAELLHELGVRIKDMIELSIAEQKAKPPVKLDAAATEAHASADGVVASRVDESSVQQHPALATTLQTSGPAESVVEVARETADAVLAAAKREFAPTSGAPVPQAVRDDTGTSVATLPEAVEPAVAGPEAANVAMRCSVNGEHVQTLSATVRSEPVGERDLVDLRSNADAEKAIATGRAGDIPQSNGAANGADLVQSESPATTNELSLDRAAKSETVNEKLREPEDEHPAEVSSSDAACASLPNRESEAPSVAAAPLHSVRSEPQATVEIDEDPGDLFEPMPISGALYALPIQTTIIMVTPIAPVHSAPRLTLNRPMVTHNSNPTGAELDAKQPASAMSAAVKPENHAVAERVATGPAKIAEVSEAGSLADASPRANGAATHTTREVPRPPPSDPLAPIRALSEEELIALFS